MSKMWKSIAILGESIFLLFQRKPNIGCMFMHQNRIIIHSGKCLFCMPIKNFFHNYRKKIRPPTNNFSSVEQFLLARIA